jgi:hypothetical protein
MTTRLTGPGFSMTAESSGSQNIHLGDGYLMLGLSLLDRDMNLEYDLGSVISFPLIERLTHQGINHGVMLSVVWRGKNK